MGQDGIKVCPVWLETLLGLKGEDKCCAKRLDGHNGDLQAFIIQRIMFADTAIMADEMYLILP